MHRISDIIMKGLTTDKLLTLSRDSGFIIYLWLDDIYCFSPCSVASVAKQILSQNFLRLL